MIIFTYGTLLPGGSRYEAVAPHVLDTAAGTFEGRLFAMPDGIPIVVEDVDAYPIEGTLLYLPDNPTVADQIDQLVGVKSPRSLFRRVQRRIINDRGDSMVWIYICKTTEIDRVTAEGTELVEGDWRLFEEGDE